MPTGANKKKKYTYVWVSLVVLVFGIFAVREIGKRFADGSVVELDRMHGTPDADALSYITDTNGRRQVPRFSFLNQDSVRVTNEDYAGKVYVVDFFFTTCPTICPVMTQNLVEIQDTFSGSDAFGVASFSINPRYDVPHVLRTYASKYGVADPDWNLMTGDQSEIHRLANEGFYILAAENGEAPGGFEHSGLFALVDKQGYLRSRTDKFGNPLIYYRGMIPEAQGTNAEGEAQQITMLKEDIKKLLAD
ncbi:SCO family protein [Flagellimonas sp. DF-77]|uniref:SCO family protein n=1 Tax=Flagellimonas algarum TaxID=3230298 RepID=UPI0033988360